MYGVRGLALGRYSDTRSGTSGARQGAGLGTYDAGLRIANSVSR